MNDTSEFETMHRSQSVVPGQRVRLTGETARVMIPVASCSGQPTVELIRDGDVVQAIDVTCGCGERIRLRCMY